MGCIHSQTRSIFRGNRNLDQINTTKLQCIYDEGRDSDSIMLLKVYTEWIRHFHTDLLYKEDDVNVKRDERPFRKNGWRLFLKHSPCKFQFDPLTFFVL